MRKQRNMSQMKEQDKTSEKELNKIEASNLPDTEFKNTGYKDAQGTQWELQQRDSKYKKEPVRNKEYNNWNKEYIISNKQ